MIMPKKFTGEKRIFKRSFSQGGHLIIGALTVRQRGSTAFTGFHTVFYTAESTTRLALPLSSRPCCVYWRI